MPAFYVSFVLAPLASNASEFIASYALTYLGYNVTTAYGEACKQCGRCPNYFSSSALGWWCLTEKQNRSDVGDCLDFAGCTLFKDCHAHGPTAPGRWITTNSFLCCKARPYSVPR